MSPRLQRLAPPGKPDLTVESPYAPITIPPAACLLQASSSRTSPMQPISASTYEHTAARTRRKWGERRGGESIVAFATDNAPFSVVWVRNWSKGAAPAPERPADSLRPSCRWLSGTPAPKGFRYGSCSVFTGGQCGRPGPKTLGGLRRFYWFVRQQHDRRRRVRDRNVIAAAQLLHPLLHRRTRRDPAHHLHALRAGFLDDVERRIFIKRGAKSS